MEALLTVDEAARIVLRGGVVVVPTETVYGLAAKPEPVPIARLFAMKGRPKDKSLQLLVRDATWLERLGRPSQDARLLAHAFWPGPLTIVVPAISDAPEAIVRDGTIGMRVPDHDVALALLDKAGPLAASSANRSGAPTPSDIDAIRSVFGGNVDGYLDGGTIEGSGSTVVDASAGELRVLREGPVTRAQIAQVVSGRFATD